MKKTKSSLKKKNSKGRSSEGDGGGILSNENESPVEIKKEVSVSQNIPETSALKTVTFSELPKDAAACEEFPSLSNQLNKSNFKQPKKNKKKKK